MTDIAVTVNGQQRPLAGTPAHATALDWLRDNGLSGSKEGCAEGECGACAMLLATPTADGGTAWTPVNACLVPVYALDGQEFITAEGLGSPDDLHPVQAKLAEAGGSQCGYCTPGFACSMAGEYYRADRTPADDADADDDTCPVHDRARPERLRPARAERQPVPLHRLPTDPRRRLHARLARIDDPLQQRLARPRPEPVATDAEVDGARFVRPATLPEALRILHDEKDALLVAGSTDWGVEVNIRGRRPLVVAIEQLPELRA
jgi:xanthine dehydrogenase small subunit